MQFRQGDCREETRRAYKIHISLGQIGQIGSAVYLAGSSKMAPRILVFSIAMGVDISFYVKTLETHASAFLTLDI